MTRRLRRNVPEGYQIWAVKGVDVNDSYSPAVRTYLLLPAGYDEYDAKTVWRRWGNRQVPQLSWFEGWIVEPGDEHYPGHASALVPEEVALDYSNWQLTEYRPPPPAEEPRDTDRGRPIARRTGRLLGIVVNPKMQRPLMAISHSGEIVSIYRMDTDGWTEEGKGYYDQSCENDMSDHGYAWPCDTTGCVRVHSPSGVINKSEGYGTSLYMGLLLGAHLHEQTDVAESYSGCISSGDIDGTGRSSSARAWWRGQAERGLARSGTAGGDEEEYEDEGVDATQELGDNLIGESVNDGEVTYVNRISVDVRGTRPGEGEWQSISYEAALEASLIIAALDLEIDPERQVVSTDMYWKLVQSGAIEVHEVYVDPILALDVRGLTLDAINLLGFLAGVGGATGKQLDNLRQRWELNLDPNEAVQQLYLLPNPARRDAAEAIAEVQEIRQRLGWDRWENDEDG